MGCYTQDGFVFIHIPKTGGTAVKKALWDNVPGMKGQMPALLGSPEADRKPTKENPFPIGHIPLRDVERLLGRPAKSWKAVVAVVRNPYAQQVSQYLFWHDRYQRGGRHEHDLAASAYPSIHGWLEDPRCDFHRWYNLQIHPSTMIENPQNLYRGFAGTYLWWVTSQSGTVPPNLVLLQQEDLRSQFAAFTADHLGEPITLPEVNRGGYSRDRFMEYLVHEADPRRTLRALDLIEAKFRWAFSNVYPRMSREPLLERWARTGQIRELREDEVWRM